MKTRYLVLCAAVAAFLAVSGQVSAQHAGPGPYAMMPVGGAPVAGPMAPAYAAAPAVLAVQAPKPLTTAGVSAEAGQGQSCSACACGNFGCGCGWAHRMSFFAEFLYLRARDADVAYAVEISNPAGSPPGVPIQVSPMGVVDHGFDPGFRGGVGFACSDYAGVTASYSRFRTNRLDRLQEDPAAVGTAISSMVYHPATYQAGFHGPWARAEQDINFDLIDLDYRELFACGQDFKLAYLAGARYAILEQEFQSIFGANSTRTVASDIDFDGVGLRLGLEGERYSRSGRFMIYGRGIANFLAGKFNGDYSQGQNFNAADVDTGWEASRITPVFELEVGAGWTSRCGTWRLLGGYTYTAWTNVVKTDDFIQAVQRNNFTDMSDDLTFDGLVARFEGRF